MKDGSEVLDLSTATVKQFIFKRKGLPNLVVDCDFETDGSDGVLIYVSREGDISVLGSWQWQAYIETPIGHWHTDITAFTVYPNLDT
jgi:hypothetical protein